MQLTGTALLVWCLLAVTAAAAQAPSASAAEKWVTRKDAQGITVSEREAPRDAFKHLKVEMTLKTSLKRLASLVMDVEGYPAWVDRTRESRVIEKTDETSLVYRAIIALPVLKDRDLVAGLSISQDKISRVVTARSAGVPSKYPPDARFERIQDFKISWAFIPLPGGNVRVEYRAVLPDDFAYSVAKSLVWSGLHRTLANMRSQVQQQKQPKLETAYIVELE
jgi:ribosome-associated toxin RatA of RatAB toxin-antitoxin module